MNEESGRQGYIKMLLVFAIFIGVAFVGITFGKPYFRYNTLRSHTKDILSSEITAVPLIREKVLEEAAELNVPLKEENLEVTVKNKIITVKATWSETVNFWE